MANLAFNQNGMLSRPRKPMDKPMGMPGGGALTPMAPPPQYTQMGPGAANDLGGGTGGGIAAPAPQLPGLSSGDPTARQNGGVIGGPMGGEASYLLPTDPNAPPGGNQRMMQAMQSLFGGGNKPPMGLGMSAPAPQMGGGMTATRPSFGYGRRIDPGLR